ncbi:hypothetical protein BGX38DRAFT_714828 [Terfezia claveryi]|nr:hypothetical protein BGX38DRAFT_714828 [Terfezia claveryi]
MSKPTDDYSSPPNQPEAPAKSIDLHSTEVLLKFTRSFVLRWLEVISDGIEIFDGLQDVHEAVKSCPTYPPLETIHKGPIFNVDYQAWIQYLRCPRWPGESARMQIIRDRCSVLLGELEEGRTILEVVGVEQHTEHQPTRRCLSNWHTRKLMESGLHGQSSNLLTRTTRGS